MILNGDTPTHSYHLSKIKKLVVQKYSEKVCSLAKTK